MVYVSAFSHLRTAAYYVPVRYIFQTSYVQVKVYYHLTLAKGKILQ